MARSGGSGSAFGEIAEDDDPRIRAVYQRLRKLTIIAALTMGVGFFAVMAVIAYRIIKPRAPAAANTVKELSVPQGARVTTAADAGRLFVTVEGPDKTVIHVFDAATLAEVGQIATIHGAPAAPPTR